MSMIAPEVGISDQLLGAREVERSPTRALLPLRSNVPLLTCSVVKVPADWPGETGSVTPEPSLRVPPLSVV